MTFISGALFPISLLPGWLQPIGQAMPTTAALDGMREALYGDGEPVVGGADPRGWAVVLLPLSLWLFSLALNKARAQGALAQY